MRVVFVVEYDVADDLIERRMQRFADALSWGDDPEWRTTTVCIRGCADAVLSVAAAGDV